MATIAPLAPSEQFPFYETLRTFVRFDRTRHLITCVHLTVPCLHIFIRRAIADVKLLPDLID